MISKLRHEERLAHLGRSGKQIGAGVEQTVNDGRPALIYGFIQLIHGDCMQICRVVKAVQLTAQFFKIFWRIFYLILDFRRRGIYATNR